MYVINKDAMVATVGSYPHLYEEYLRIYDLYLNNQHLFDNPPFTNDKEKLQVQFRETKFELKKPMYSLRMNALQKLQNSKHELMKKYDFEKKRIIYGEKKDFTEIKRLTQLIHDNDKAMNELVTHFQKKKDQLESEWNHVNDAHSKSLNTKKELFDSIHNTSDDVIQKTKINQYLNMTLEDNASQREGILRKMIAVDDYTLSKPIIMSADINQTPDVKPKEKSKLEKKIKEKLKKSTPKTETEVKKEWKQNVMKGIFGSLSDCKSTKHSKPYYLSKAQIYALIEKDAQLKKKVGKMYKKLSRDELCDKLML
jgi:hypothetical protein